MSKCLDVIVWGSTGLTGKLVCEYLRDNYPTVKWAISGRNFESLQNVKKSLKLDDSVKTIVANLDDSASLDAMISQTKVLLTTAGPYTFIGEPVVESCVRCNTHYCDLTGEPTWIRKMIDKYHDQAEKRKIKIVHSCGFDCVPNDLGAEFMVQELTKRNATPDEVRFSVDDAKGAVSGGTLSSCVAIFEQNTWKELIAVGNPFYLNPAETQEIVKPMRSKLLDILGIGYDPIEKKWTAPYFFQTLDTRVINRSNALKNFSYGKSFIYSERMLFSNPITAALTALSLQFGVMMVIVPFFRFFLKLLIPKSGKALNAKAIDSGYFSVKLWGKGTDKDTGSKVIVRGGISARDGDPGYRQTAKMLVESALCLALDEDKNPKQYGILTPSVAMSTVLLQRINEKGIRFYLVD